MTLVRSHLRLSVGAWLICHLLTFTTLVACDCCSMTDDSVAAAAEAPCHEAEPPPEPHCDHMTQDGAACPMHRAAAPTAPACAMSATCGTAGAMLQAVLLQPALLSSVVEIDAPLDLALPSASHRPNAVSLAIPPDAPPPRA